MKRKIFDFGLYVDSLRRTALVGGLFTALMSVQSVIVAVGYFISASEAKSRTMGQYSISTVGLLEINPMIFAIPLLMVPFLMVALFGFLTKRSASDFWHSIPFSRECIYTTFILAALSWTLAATLISGSISVVGFLLMPHLYAINFMSVLYIIPGVIAIAFLVMGTLAISSSLTGTSFNNFVVAALILFLPRTFILYFDSLCSNSSLFPSVFGNSDSTSLNLLFSAFTGSILSTNEMNSSMTSVSAIIYTFILGIVYLVIGALLFKHRKSEAASLSSINKHVQTVLRTIVSLIICFVPIYLIRCTSITDSADIFLVLVMYVIAVITYLLYELITTKKAKNMLKCLPQLWILVVANIVLIVASAVIYNIEFSYTPTAETVKSVKISDNKGSRNYFNVKMSKINISDDELEAFLCEAYDNTRLDYSLKELRSAGHEVINVTFKNGIFSKSRNVYLDAKEYQKLGELLDKNEDVKAIYDVDAIFKNAIHSTVNIYVTNSELTEAQHNAIMTAYINDIKGMPFSEWYALANDVRGEEMEYYAKYGDTSSQIKQEHYYQLGNVSCSINIGGNSYYANFPLTNQMPTAYNLTLGYLCDYQNSKNAVENLAKKLSQPNNYDANINITLYNGQKRGASEYYTIYKNPELNKKLLDAVSPCFGEVPDANSRIAVINYNPLYTTKNSDENITVIIKVPDDADLKFLIDNPY